MSRNKREIPCRSIPKSLFLITLILGLVLFPHVVRCETYGIKDSGGNFVPKVVVTIDKKEIVIKKTDPREKFRTINLKLNASNRQLIKNSGQLIVEWIRADNTVSKPAPFVGSYYNPTTHAFQDSLEKSIGVKITDKSKDNLFVGKRLPDILSLRIDDVPLLSAEAATERERTIQMGAGRDVSLNVSKSKLIFNEGNLKTGEFIHIDNRSGLDQAIGVEVPLKGFALRQLRKRLEQTKIPEEEWGRFTLPADQGVFLLLIPDPDATQLSQLSGKEIVIKSYQGNEVRETRRIPIEISSALRHATPDFTSGREASGSETRQVPPQTASSGSKPVTSADPSQTRSIDARGFFWLWVILLANLLLSVGCAFYMLFFLLPRIQVFQDRVSKSEMFIHGSREAIREELDQLKRELMDQYRVDERRE